MAKLAASMQMPTAVLLGQGLLQACSLILQANLLILYTTQQVMAALRATLDLCRQCQLALVCHSSSRVAVEVLVGGLRMPRQQGTSLELQLVPAAAAEGEVACRGEAEEAGEADAANILLLRVAALLLQHLAAVLHRPRLRALLLQA